MVAMIQIQRLQVSAAHPPSAASDLGRGGNRRWSGADRKEMEHNPSVKDDDTDSFEARVSCHWVSTLPCDSTLAIPV